MEQATRRTADWIEVRFMQDSHSGVLPEANTFYGTDNKIEG
jgi:hypothetical protein